TLRLDAAALLLVGMWNIIVTIANGESEQIAWAAAGVVQIVWSIQRFRKHGEFVRVQHIPKSLAKEVEKLVSGTQRARVDREQDVVTFRANNKLWKARLLPDLVVAVAGNAQEVRFVTPGEFALQVSAETEAKRWLAATVQLGYDSWTGTVSQVAVPHYDAWRAARDGAPEKPVSVELSPAVRAAGIMPSAPDVQPTSEPTVSAPVTYAPANAVPAKAAPRLSWIKWAVLGVIVMLLVCVVTGFFAYRVLGQREFSRAEAAYENGDFKQAFASLSRVNTIYRFSGAPYMDTARVYWQACEPIDRADTLYQEGKYEEAAQDYRTYLADSPEGPFAVYVHAGLQDTYVEWSESLVTQGEYLNALDVMGHAYAAYEDEPVPAAIETAFQDALLGLARDDGEDAKDTIAASWEAICAGGTATSQAVGLLSTTSAKAWYKGSRPSLPVEMVATQPGTFRYAVCLEEELDTVQSCRYMPAGVVKRQTIAWHITVRDTLTGKSIASKTFEGGEPKKCPASWTFMGKSLTGTLKGTPPDNAEIVDWLAATMGTDRPAETVAIEPPKLTPEPEAEPTHVNTPVPAAKQVNLTIYVNWVNDDLDVLESMIDDYRDLHPNMTFDLITTFEKDLIETVLAAGEADLLLWSGLDIPRWAENGSIISLSQYADEDWVREQYINAAAETVLHEGEVYGLPVRAATMAMIYNRALISNEDMPTTTDDLLEQASAWTETDAYFVYEPKIYFFSAGWFHGGEAWIMNRECVPNLDVPDGVAAAALIAAFRELMPANVDYGLADGMFRGGAAPITLNGPWALTVIEKDGIDYGVAPMPKISATGHDPAPYVDPAVWMVTARAKQRDATEMAWDLIQFLTNAESQRTLAQQRNMIPTVRAAAEPGWFGDRENIAAFYTQAERGVPMPPSSCGTSMWTETNAMLQAIWDGADPADAVSDAQKALETLK
ncbi:MAG: extracellular solute-binding protein, partial [Anaerolineae bacterium]|nr:extracellular solute-binding protein [Anaerolineae bacterium]